MAKSKTQKSTRKRRETRTKAGQAIASKAKGALSPEQVKQYAASFDLKKERQQPRLLSILFCDFASFTLDKKVNLLGIFDRVFVHPERKKTPVFTLFVRTAETTNERLAVTLFQPDGKAGLAFQFGGEHNVFTPNLPAQVQLLIGVQFVAEVEGPYWFDVAYKGKSLGGAGLVVEYREVEGQDRGTDTYV